MIDQEARSERIAIRMDSHIPESKAISITDAEIKAKEPNENIQRIQKLHERKKLDDAEKHHKRSSRFTYD